MSTKYNQIGINYNQTRKADPHLLDRLQVLLQAAPQLTYLDIGCGTGNYTSALQERGVRLIGVDPSSRMLTTAQAKNDQVQWLLGTAEALPLATEQVNGILASLTLHHWTDLSKGFAELYRVLQPDSPVVIFTSTPQQMKGYWLNHYFPKMLQDSMRQMPSLEKVQKAMSDNGFHLSTTEKYFIKEDLQDLFLYSGKHRPDMYLQPAVRQGISSFSALANAQEVEQGLLQLAADIKSGAIQKIISQYENEDGDYLFIIGKKS